MRSNLKMRVNHEQTKRLILNIVDMLRNQAQTAKKFKGDSDVLIADNRMSQEFKNERIEELRNNYNAKYNEIKEKVEEKLNAIIPIELENEKILEFDVPEFANTLAVINAAQGKLPSDIIEGIKLNFAGQYQALLAIKATFERYEVDLSAWNFEEYTTSAGFAIQSLITQASNIEQSEVSTFISLQKLFRAVIRFGEVRGIKFSASEKTFASNDETSEALARQAMGLD